MHSIDRRKIAIHIYSIIGSLRKTAILVQASHTSISRWLKNLERKKYTRQAPKSQVISDLIRSSLANDPFISVRKFESLINKSLNIKVSRELIRTVIKKSGFSKKKASFFSVPSYLEKRTAKFVRERNHYIDIGRLIVSLDETSFSRHSKAVYGFSPKGEPIRLKKKGQKAFIDTTSVMVAISKHGLIKKHAVRGSHNTELFEVFLRDLELPWGTVILLDNVSFHHAAVIKELAKKKHWVLLYVPAYSPWFNPIEEAFSIVKRHYYKNSNIEQAFDSLTADHCNAFFRHSFSLNEIQIKN